MVKHFFALVGSAKWPELFGFAPRTPSDHIERDRSSEMFHVPAPGALPGECVFVANVS